MVPVTVKDEVKELETENKEIQIMSEMMFPTCIEQPSSYRSSCSLLHHPEHHAPPSQEAPPRTAWLTDGGKEPEGENHLESHQ
jgi:hypothetical protein